MLIFSLFNPSLTRLFSSTFKARIIFLGFTNFKPSKELKLMRLPGFEPGLGAWGAPVLDQSRPQPQIQK